MVLAMAMWGLADFDLLAASKTQVRLVLSAETARPGTTVLAGVHLTMAPGWHIYWRNPGDSGMPTRLKWTLPQGVTAGEIQWPIPEKYSELDLTTFIYKEETMLVVPLTIASNTVPGSMRLGLAVDWLECNKSCVPGDAKVEATFTVGEQDKPAAAAPLIAQWQQRAPATTPAFSVRATWEASTNADSRFLVVRWPASAAATNADFFPYLNEGCEVLGDSQSLPPVNGENRIRKEARKTVANWPKQIAGLMVLPAAGTGEKTGFGVVLAPDDWGAPPGGAMKAAPPPASVLPPASFWVMLGYAFIGGLILNIMPCVLPVIALKILSFVNQSREDPGRIRYLGLVYAAGVLVSFLALAAVAIGVKAAGHQAGWGMQFGNPEFLVGLTVLVTLVALNLFGLFEVILAGGVMGTVGNLTAKEGASGAFFNGVLATALATPCTAPILGTALGFAFGQPPWVIVAMLLTVGLGLAAPYVLLCWQPAWLRFLPKPGIWMQHFKVAMGFPMLATALWLFTLTIRFYGKRVWWFALFLVLLAMALWIYGEFVQRGRKRRSFAMGIALGLVVAGYLYAVEGQLQWRTPMLETNSPGSLQESPDGIAWQRWTPEAVAKGLAEGRPVLVDFTADWCITCQVNQKTSIEITSVREKIKANNALALLGDYTTQPTNITAELQRHGRAGVPMVLVYPKDPAKEPILLPEFLTPGRVLAALDQAAR